jgi:hypothetical protein
LALSVHFNAFENHDFMFEASHLLTVQRLLGLASMALLHASVRHSSPIPVPAACASGLIMIPLFTAPADAADYEFLAIHYASCYQL